MRLNLAVLALGAALVAGCGRQGDVAVVYKGQTPTNTKVKDDRSVEFRCPACGKSANADAQKCSCGAKISWAKAERPCGYCQGTGDCSACRLMNQSDGNCYNCRGKGYLTVLGKTPACPNCKQEGGKGDGKCASCRKVGAGKCDFCDGKGVVGLDALKQRTQAPGATEADPPKKE